MLIFLAVGRDDKTESFAGSDECLWRFLARLVLVVFIEHVELSKRKLTLLLRITIFKDLFVITLVHIMCSPRVWGGGRQGIPKPPEKSQKYRFSYLLTFLSNTFPDPLLNHKANKQEFSVRPPSARQRNAI